MTEDRVIVDAHCHLWERWPNGWPAPEPDRHAPAAALLRRMEAAGVDHAVVICAAIGDNPRNVDYAFDCAGCHPGRLTVFPDIECFWHDSFRQPGAPGRLELALARWDFRGFTQYLA